MARNEAALRELLARYQPELAGRLAKRIAQYGATDAVLAEGAKPEPSPLLRDIIDAALAEEKRGNPQISGSPSWCKLGTPR
eukprot:g16936.t1